MAPDPAPRFTLATQLTLARMAAAIPIAWLILAGASRAAVVALLLAALTDYLDGYLARRRSEVTPLGTALDPIADKLLTVAALVAFIAVGTISGIHLAAALAILLRETLVAGLRESAGAGSSLAVSRLAKWKTAMQFVSWLLLAAGLQVAGLVALWLAAILTVYTGAQYTRKWLTSV
jgi:CDP-diacylglycerol--glycerol-3-phosphate 3-phosphatidyltransferase